MPTLSRDLDIPGEVESFFGVLVRAEVAMCEEGEYEIDCDAGDGVMKCGALALVCNVSAIFLIYSKWDPKTVL